MLTHYATLIYLSLRPLSRSLSRPHPPPSTTERPTYNKTMANVQVVRTRQTYATTTINRVQSIQLVQTMLHGALSTLTYLRELFPERAFDDRYYEMRETPLPYADFAAARMPSLKGKADPHSTKVPVLMRQRSNRVDMFLDWLVSAFACSNEDMLIMHRRKASSQSSNRASYVQCSCLSTLTRRTATQCLSPTLSPCTTLPAKTGSANRAD